MPKYPKYPIKPKQYDSSLPMAYPSVPQSIIPTNSKDHNVGGQVKTIIHMRNARGEEITVYQNQQVLNLLNNAHGFWSVGSHPSHINPKKSHKSHQRRNKYVR